MNQKEMKRHFEDVMSQLRLPTSSKPGKGDMYYDRPFYQLDYNQVYGGYMIALVGVDGSSGHYTVFTLTRMKPQEMKRFLDGLLYGQRIKTEYRGYKKQTRETKRAQVSP